MPTLPSRKRKSLKEYLKANFYTHYQIAAALIIGALQLAFAGIAFFFTFLAILTLFA